MHIHLPFAFAVLLSSAGPGQDSTPPDPLRDTVRGAIAWIGRQAVPVRGVEGAVLFPAAEGDKRMPQTNVYGVWMPRPRISPRVPTWYLPASLRTNSASASSPTLTIISHGTPILPSAMEQFSALPPVVSVSLSNNRRPPGGG